MCILYARVPLLGCPHASLPMTLDMTGLGTWAAPHLCRTDPQTQTPLSLK